MPNRTAVFSRKVQVEMGAAPVEVSAETGCGKLAALLRRQAAGSAVITGPGGEILGIVTEQDMTRRVAFQVDAETPVSAVMTETVATVSEEDYLYQAIATMRRLGLRHLPVVDSNGRVAGVLDLHRALAAANPGLIDQIDTLTHADSRQGLKAAKAAQTDVARQLFDERTPALDIQLMLTGLNNDLYRRAVDLCLEEMAAEGLGGPPVEFEVLVMGSGGRGESFLYPDQDNGFILADYDDADHTLIDAWFIDLATRVTGLLDEIGIPLCKGYVMASNPLWRKNLTQWQAQTRRWVGKGEGQVLRLADIFFDFIPVHGAGGMTAALRRHITEVADAPFFLREMYKIDAEFGVPLTWFGRLNSMMHDGEEVLNLKHTGTLPLVNSVRLLALSHQIPETATTARMAALRAAGVLAEDEWDYLDGALRLITNLLLRQQLEDAAAGKRPSNYVPRARLSDREEDQLIDAFKAIRRLKDRVRGELTGDIF